MIWKQLRCQCEFWSSVHAPSISRAALHACMHACLLTQITLKQLTLTPAAIIPIPYREPISSLYICILTSCPQSP